MAAIVFTASANGTTASQQLTAGARACLITGTFASGQVRVDISHDNTNWAPLSRVSHPLSSAICLACSIPTNWYARVAVMGAVGVPSIVVAME